MKKCMLAATNIQGEESISSSLTTPTLCGGQNQSTTESIILDKDVVTESRVGQKMAFNLIFFYSFFKLLWSIAVCVYPTDFGLMACELLSRSRIS